MLCFRCSTVLLVWIVGFSPACASLLVGSNYSGIVVIGDSLSDVGNINSVSHAVIGQPNPAPPYFAGRFSNGPLWIDYVGSALGLDASTPFVAGGNNYAIGGAQIGLSNGAVEDAIGEIIGDALASVVGNLGMTTQSIVHALDGGSVDGNELYVMWGGGNDFLQHELATDINGMALSAALNIFILHGAGARDILVPNVPPIGSTPRFRGTEIEDPLNDLVASYNGALADVLFAMDILLGDMEINYVDVNSFFNQMTELAPPSFNVTDPAFENGTVVGDPNQYMFWDTVHPTALSHLLLAQFVLNEGLPPLSTVTGNYFENAVDGQLSNDLIEIEQLAHQLFPSGKVPSSVVPVPEPTGCPLMFLGSWALFVQIRRRPREDSRKVLSIAPAQTRA